MRIKFLEDANAELKSANLKLKNEFEELEQHLKHECQTSNNLSVSLNQELQARRQLETELRLLRQQKGLFI